MPEKKASAKKRTSFPPSGQFVVKKGSKTSLGEHWHIVDRNGNVERTSLTSSSSAAALDGITIKHSKVLKKLAKD